MPVNPPLFTRFLSSIFKNHRHNRCRGLDLLEVRLYHVLKNALIGTSLKRKEFVPFLAGFCDSGCIFRTFLLRWTNGTEYCVHRYVPKGNRGLFGLILGMVEIRRGLLGMVDRNMAEKLGMFYRKL